MKKTGFPTRLSHTWALIGFLILSIRFVQGWIFWGGGSRRFIYAPEKLDPHASSWLANKMQAAMPGAILGMQEVLSFLLTHFYLLYPAIILFSLVELVAGLGLIFGFMTRFCGFITALLSISLMLLFGWQGSTCLDEWTMAVSNLAMGLTLALSGAPNYSIDALLLRWEPQLQKRWLFRNLASYPLPLRTIRNRGVVFGLFTILFTLGTYNYYRGAIFTRYHAGPVSPTIHHLTVTAGQVSQDGTVKFKAYIDAGTPVAPAYIMKIALYDANNKMIESWEGKQLSTLPLNQIHNEYLYNRFHTGTYGLVAALGSKAIITLNPFNKMTLAPGQYQIKVNLINDQSGETPAMVQ